MNKLLMGVVAGILSLGLLTACGGGAASQEITISLGEGGQMKFNPDTFAVNKGETVKLTLVNKDPAQPHSLIINGLKFKSSQVPAGKTQSFTLKASQSGTFDVACDVPGHKEAGMVGKVEVK